MEQAAPALLRPSAIQNDIFIPVLKLNSALFYVFISRMPKVKDALNGFSVAEVHTISGLSLPMIDYLKRHGFLHPAYCSADNPRGRVRYYSYRDLVVAKMIQCFRESGVQLARLKSAAQRLSDDSFWPDGDVPASGLNWVVSDGSGVAFWNRGPLWTLSIISSRIHLVWIDTICGRLRNDFSYSNTLGWNTFPIPKLTEQNKADLARCAEDILLARETHFPATIADLYEVKDGESKMPENLRHAHERNDEVLERIYIGRRFKNDTERLEKLFELYTRMTGAKAAA